MRQCLAAFCDQRDRIQVLENRIFHLNVAVRTSAIKNEKLEAELAERLPLPAALKKLRERDKTIESLHKEIARQRKANGRLGNKIKALRAQRARLQARILQLRSSRAVLSKAVFGGKSEKQDKPRSERKRGQQRGAPATAVPRGPSSRRRRNGGSRRRTR